MSRETFTYNGKRYDITAADDKALAVKIAMLKKALDDGTVIVSKNTKVSKWAEEWLETYKKGSVGASAYNIYKTNLYRHILPSIGSMRLKDVKPMHLQKILNSRAGHSKSHIDKVRQLLFQLFRKAKSNRLILDNPAEELEPPKAVDGFRRSITDTERKYILLVSETHKAGLWIKTMLYTGLRPGETAALRWNNIDLINKTIRVDSARKAQTNEIKEPKSASGNRLVPLPDILLVDLINIKHDPFDFVFTQETTGRPHTKQSMYGLWTSFKRDMNIAMGARVYRNQVIAPYPVSDDLIPYCLRHTYCTDLQDAGVPINVAKDLMGHSDISITAKIYTHRSTISFNNAAEAINKLHNPKKNESKPDVKE